MARPKAIRVRYLDHENEIRELEAEGLLATCIQHEMDHLDGVLFVDHITALKRNIILRKLLKAQEDRRAGGRLGPDAPPCGSPSWARRISRGAAWPP